MGIVNKFGTNITAAFSIASRLDSFAMLPAMSLSMAVTTFTAQNIGAGKQSRVSSGLRTSILILLFISTLISAVFLLKGFYIIGLFTRDKDVVYAGYEFFKIVAWFYVFFGIMFCFAGVMRGAGDVFIPMIFSIFTLWLIRIPLSIILSNKIGYLGIWFAFPVSWILGALLNALYYFTGRWKRKSLIKSFTTQSVSSNNLID